MEIPISQDIRKFKTKDIGNFSFKEAGFLAVGLAIGFVVYKVTNSYEYAIPPMFIIFVFGFFKPFGLTFVQFLKTVIRENLFTPKTYIWETDFEYGTEEEMKELYGKDLDISSEWVIQTQTDENKKAGYKPTKFEKPYLIK